MLGEYQHTEGLLDKLQKITQENGRIKKGYEERAEIITNTLSHSLGIEIVDGQIVKYGELKQSLEELIQKKKLETLLRVYEEEYTESLKNQIAAKEELAKNQGTLGQFQEEYNAVLRDKVAWSKQDYLSQEQREALNAKYSGGITDLLAAEQALSEKIQVQRGVVEERKATLESMNTTVGNYEYALSAAASGGVEEMDKAILAMAGQLQLAEASNQYILEQQMEDFNNAYQEAANSVENGSMEITQAD